MLRRILALMASWGDLNIGMICGASRVTVVDYDGNDPAELDVIEHLFGKTPVIVATPSGGFHLYYRHNGEGNRNLRLSHGLKVDIKAVNIRVL